MRLIIALLAIIALAACEQRYRYACQNPNNWDTAQCQKPLCEVNQECPEHIFNGTKVEIAPAKEVKNECK